MNELLIWSDGVQYLCTWRGPHASEIRDLFGTDTLPTPWLANADPEVVRDDIAKHNAECVVRLAGAAR